MNTLFQAKKLELVNHCQTRARRLAEKMSPHGHYFFDDQPAAAGMLRA